MAAELAELAEDSNVAAFLRQRANQLGPAATS